MRAFAVAVFIVIAGILPAGAAEIAFPALSGRVVDQANILSSQTKQNLTATLEGLEKATTNQMVVVTLASLQGQAIEDYGYQLGRTWGIGRAGKNNGVLLIVAPKERSVRIEVGYGLEGTITDALARGLIEQEILPRFRDNDYDGGVRAGVTTLTQILMGDAKTASRLTEVGTRKVAPTDGNWTWPLILFIVMFFVLPRFIGGGGFRGRRLGGIGGGGFGRSSGGGFRGGGGSFGGGGASGRW